MVKILTGIVKPWLKQFAGSYQNPGALTISYATSQHLVEAAVLLFTSSANASVGLSAMLVAVPDGHILSVLLLISAVLATWSMHSRTLEHWLAAFLLLPQQGFLAIAFTGAVWAVVTGHYADGYVPQAPHPSVFIFADQWLRIGLAPIYTVAFFARSTWYGGGRFGLWCG